MKKFTMEELKGRMHALQRERTLTIMAEALNYEALAQPFVEQVTKLLDHIDLVEDEEGALQSSLQHALMLSLARAMQTVRVPNFADLQKLVEKWKTDPSAS